MNSKRFLTRRFTGSFILLILLTLLLGNLSTASNFANAMSAATTSSDIMVPTDKPFEPYIGQNCSKIGEYASNYGLPRDLVIVEHEIGLLVCITIYEGGLLILDITNPDEPTFLTYFDALPYSLDEICSSGNYLYLTTTAQNYLIVVNIQRPQTPIVVTIFYDLLFSDLTNLQIKNDILFGCERNLGLLLLNISNPETPTFLKRYIPSVGSNPNLDALHIDDQYAFIGYFSWFIIVDWSDPQALLEVNIYTFTGGFPIIKSVFVAKDYAYVGFLEGENYILDISNKQNISIVNYYQDFFNYVKYIFVDNDISYQMHHISEIRSINLTNPYNPKMIDRYVDVSYYEAMEYYEGRIYLLDTYEGLEILAVNSTCHLTLQSVYYFGGSSSDLAIRDNFAYVVNGYNGLEVYQLKRDTKPEFKFRINLKVRMDEIYLDGDFAYVYSRSDYKLYRFDISKPKEPVFLDSHSLIVILESEYLVPITLTVSNSLLFVSYYAPFFPGTTREVAVYDVTNINYTQTLVKIPFSTYIHKIIVVNNYLYLCTTDELYIYSFTDETSELISRTTVANGFIDSFLYRSKLFTTNVYGMSVFDVFDRTQPIHLSDYVIPGLPAWISHGKIVVDNDVAFVCLSPNEYAKQLFMIDFTNVTNPYIIGIYSCNETINNFELTNGYVYLASGTINLIVLELDGFRTPSKTGFYIGVSISAVVAIVLFVGGLLIRRKRITDIIDAPEEPVAEEPITLPHPDEIDIDVKREDFESEEVYEFAQEIFDDYDEPEGNIGQQ